MSKFKCNITYKKIPGNSLLSTQNKLRAHGFVDQYWNVKVDIATWRDARSELNELASAKLGSKVNLFEEKKLLNSIRAVPVMKYFSMIDQMKKENITNYQPQFVRDEIGIDEQGDSVVENIQLDSRSIESTIYESIGQRRNSVIKEENISNVKKQIEEFNSKPYGKKLSLVEVHGGWIINSTFTSNYLYRNEPTELDEIKVERKETTSNSNFSLPCIRN